MAESPDAGIDVALDVGEYCRQIEAHLTRVNDGQIIRIVGPAFELARGWARTGVPLSVVRHGIDLKAERHHARGSKRPLRLEFCEADVAAVYRHWQRAVGLRGRGHAIGDDGGDDGMAIGVEPKAPSLTRQLDRAIDRLARVVGRLDRSETFREAAGSVLQELTELRETARGTRGAAKATITGRLPELDRRLVEAGRAEVGADGVAALQEQGEQELRAFRHRLDPGAWDECIALSVTRLVRESLGLPTLVGP